MFIPTQLSLKPLFTADGGGGTATGNDPAKNGSGDANANVNGSKDAPDAKDAKFTQADVDRIIGERLARAEEATLKKLFETVGVKDVNALVETLNTHQTQLQQARDEAQQARVETQQAQVETRHTRPDPRVLGVASQLEQATAQANDSLMRAATIVHAGNFFDPNEAWLYVDKTQLTLNADGTVTGAKDAVEAVAKLKPHLVKPAGHGKGTPHSSGGKSANANAAQPMQVHL